MWFLYLDESGDLGFDFSTKHPSRFFTVCILVVQGIEQNRRILAAVKKTIRRKLSRRVRPELKGTRTSLGVRTHFYEQIENVPFDIYALTLDKRRAHEELTQRKDRVYESIARQVIDQIPVEAAATRVELIIDRSKSKREIISFNGYIARQLRARLDRRVQLHIDHHRSTQNLGLQAADLFSWGIFRRYERNDPTWFDVFRSKIRQDEKK